MSNGTEEDVRFSGSTNTMIALALVASALALALSVWSLSRIGDVEAYLAVQAVRSARQAATN